MSKTEINWTARRTAVLEQMRAQRGAQRSASKGSEDHNDLLGEYFEPFVRRRETPDGHAETKVPPAELTTFLEKFRTDKREAKKPAIAEETTEKPAVAKPGGWQGLLEEADALNFTQNFGKWLSAVPVDLGTCSSSLEELQQMLAEVTFREKALQAILKVTQTELEALESQINEKKSLAHE